MAESESPVDQLLDLVFYAPVGLAISAVEGLPHWVELGRRRVGARVDSARLVGRLAVDQGSRQGGQLLRRVAERADLVMEGLGLVPDIPETPDASQPEEAPEAAGRPETAPGAGQAPAPAPDGPEAGADPGGPAAPPSEPVDAAHDPAHLAIPGYDTLSASQVVQHLAGLSPEELEAVHQYETAGRARQTILLKVAQLRDGP